MPFVLPCPLAFVAHPLLMQLAGGATASVPVRLPRGALRSGAQIRPSVAPEQLELHELSQGRSRGDAVSRRRSRRDLGPVLSCQVGGWIVFFC